MTQLFEPIDTEAGIISGRSAIFLDNVEFSLYPNKVTLSGELNGNLCSKYKDKFEDIKYSLTFPNILGFRMIELDFGDFMGKSSFDQVINSEWIVEMKRLDSASKVKPHHKHYFLQTYDDIFEIVSFDYELSILK